MKRVAYITSGKIGIHRFTLNELILLEENGVVIDLCLTQLNTGPCMPKKNWSINIASKSKAIFQFISLLFTMPIVFKLLIEAKQKKVLSYFFISLSFFKDIKNNKISSIHCQMGDEKLYIGYFLKKIMNLPLTVTVHAHELYLRKVYDNNEAVKKLYASCDKVITISDFNAEIIHRNFDVDKKKIVVMRLFPDIDTENVVMNKTKILIVANWVKKKGYETLFKALKEIKRDDLILWVVGGSILSDDSIDLQVLIDEYQLSDKVILLGSQGSPLIDIIFNACDIFCLPSQTDFYSDGKPSEREGIPVALMEAMAWGKPVIATRHAGNPELIEDILIEERDIEGLKNAIEYLLNNPDKWEGMGNRNREIINNKYSKKNIASLVTTINEIG